MLLREYRRYFDQFPVSIRYATTAADRVVLGFVSSLRAIRRNPLIHGILAAEPDRLASSMIGEEGRSISTVQRFVADQLRREQAPGHVDNLVDAELMVRICASFLAIPSHVVDLDDDEQLAAIARQFPVPMLRPARLAD